MRLAADMGISRRTRWNVVAVALVACLLGTGATLAVSPRTAVGQPAATPAAVLARWVELGPSGDLIARAITTQPPCPSITLGPASQPMQLRAQPSLPAFPISVCEAIVPRGTASAVIGGEPLPLLKESIRRIVVIGDTGCRLKPQDGFQACNDPQAWPFAQIARRGANAQPDIVIHVGDYLYRENPCPANRPGCLGSPWGDTWNTWRADFFEPAAELLRVAPWVVTRGNHEMCARSGNGWFRFLDPHRPSVGCQKYTPPYAIPMGDVHLMVLDSSSAQDRKAPAAMVQKYRGQLAALQKAAPTRAWLITHHPLWGISRRGTAAKGDQSIAINATMQAAATALPSNVQLVLSGHIHLFQMASFAAGRPGQLIVGNSGTALLPGVPATLSGRAIAGGVVAQGITLERWGFMVMERTDTGWTATVQDGDGAVVARCNIADGSLRCTP